MHAASRTRAGQLAPQYGGEREADEIIKRAAGEIGVNQRRVDLARMAHSFQNGALGDGVEHNALDDLVLEHFLGAQHFQHMPGNGLAFAIRVGRQDYGVGVFDGLGDIGKPLASLGVDLPLHLKIVLDVHRAVFGGQVAHMAERGENLVIPAKIFVDRLGLGRRFDDDDCTHCAGILVAKRLNFLRVAPLLRGV